MMDLCSKLKHRSRHQLLLSEETITDDVAIADLLTAATIPLSSQPSF
jgi:hypothetical protein